MDDGKNQDKSAAREVLGTHAEFDFVRVPEAKLEPERNYVLYKEKIDIPTRYNPLDLQVPPKDPKYFKGYFLDRKYNRVVALHYDFDEGNLVLKTTVPQVAVVPRR